jgi:hypothetical protein
VPFADGGETTIANLQLRCRAHNAYEADVHFGPLLLRERTSCTNWVRTECVRRTCERAGDSAQREGTGGQARCGAHRRLRSRKYASDSSGDFHWVIA